MTTHACLEVRIGITVRTFCGLQIHQRVRGTWRRCRTHKTIDVTRRKEAVTCGNCERAMS